jgi:hypothetical protein
MPSTARKQDAKPQISPRPTAALMEFVETEQRLATLDSDRKELTTKRKALVTQLAPWIEQQPNGCVKVGQHIIRYEAKASVRTEWKAVVEAWMARVKAEARRQIQSLIDEHTDSKAKEDLKVEPLFAESAGQ